MANVGLIGPAGLREGIETARVMSGRGALLTVPNVLSLARVPLGAAAWLAPGSVRLLVPLVLAAAVTDVLDGLVARRSREATETGAWLDPACDKFFAVSVLLALLLAGWLSVSTLLLIATRELIVLPLVLIYRLVPGIHRRLRFDFRAGVAGKAATVSQFLAVGAALFVPRLLLPAALLSAALGVLAGLSYLHRALVLARIGR